MIIHSGVAMAESFRTRLTRWGFNLHPAYSGSGGRVTYIADDWRELKVEVPHNWRTRNYVGTIYGGSMYSAVDPMYMLMLIHILGTEYVVWDKAATIRFRKPGNSTLYAHFKIEDGEIAAIKQVLETQKSVDRKYELKLMSEDGTVHAEIEKIIYVSKKK
jgi:Domain of unknown function (DUF4442)